MRLTKNCLPSTIFTVTSTIGGPSLPLPFLAAGSAGPTGGAGGPAEASPSFGTSRGWSYISGGYGWTRRSTGDQATMIEEGARLLTLSYGGGARWFVASHFAFNFDLRFYRLPFQDADGVVPEQPGYTMFIGSAGVTFR